MIAWKEMWDRSFPSREEEWAGTYTLPRELTVEDGQLIQKPVREIGDYRKDPVYIKEAEIGQKEVTLPGVSGNVIELKFVLKTGDARKAGVKLFCTSDHETIICYDREKGIIEFDRQNSGVEITGNDEDVNRRVLFVGERKSIEFDMFLDVSSLEVFIDGGRHTMTGNVYNDPEKATGIRFFAEGGTASIAEGGAASIENLEKYDIVL